MEPNSSILFIGQPNSGKTTFLAQLYPRLQDSMGKVKLEDSSPDISAIKDAMLRLANGLETETTPSTENLSLPLNLSIDGVSYETNFMDYGGEQVKNITNLLQYDDKWLKRTKDHDRWVLFIRPNEIYHHYDLSISGYAELKKKDEQGHNLVKTELSSQYHFIELIQCLLHARGIGVKTEIKTPKLLIVLTCFDELNTEETPSQVLVSKMPMFKHFVETLWDSESYRFIGLSSQGFALDNEEARKKYQEEMPQSFGHLVLEDNSVEKDITQLLEIAINL